MEEKVSPSTGSLPEYLRLAGLGWGRSQEPQIQSKSPTRVAGYRPGSAPAGTGPVPEAGNETELERGL